MQQKKVVFTHGYFLEEDPKEKAIMRPYPPLGILYLSAFLETNGIENNVFDSTFANIDLLKQYLLLERPDIIGIYTNLMTKINVLKIIDFIKNTEQLIHTKIILGGPEVKNHAANFLKYGADVIVLGEGEETMLELVKFLCENQNIKELNHIKSIAYLDENNEIKQTESRPLLKQIDLLPMPNRKKINMQLYFDAWKKHHGQSVVSISTMRGCPYTCKWCSRAVYGQTYRRKSAKLVVDEMEFLKNTYHPDAIWFVDDVFTVSHKWLKEFADEVAARKIVFPYEIITRADRLNEETIDLLKASGCFRVWIGAESGSQKIIDAMDRRVDVNTVREMIQLAQKKGIQAGTFIMLGYPGETTADIEETIHHLKVANPDLYTITIAYPIKGTPLYEEVEANFTVFPEWDKGTDRDIDFKRTYNKKFYEYAVRLVYNEVRYHKETLKSNTNYLLLPYLKAKSYAARGAMLMERLKS
jgi:anaerobic magnesium-protoporphyrin IX monomethyl ester cyclase